jgi:hypothetical protein
MVSIRFSAGDRWYCACLSYILAPSESAYVTPPRQTWRLLCVFCSAFICLVLIRRDLNIGLVFHIFISLNSTTARWDSHYIKESLRQKVKTSCEYNAIKRKNVLRPLIFSEPSGQTPFFSRHHSLYSWTNWSDAGLCRWTILTRNWPVLGGGGIRMAFFFLLSSWHSC